MPARQPATRGLTARVSNRQQPWGLSLFLALLGTFGCSPIDCPLW